MFPASVAHSLSARVELSASSLTFSESPAKMPGWGGRGSVDLDSDAGFKGAIIL